MTLKERIKAAGYRTNGEFAIAIGISNTHLSKVTKSGNHPVYFDVILDLRTRLNELEEEVNQLRKTALKTLKEARR